MGKCSKVVISIKHIWYDYITWKLGCDSTIVDTDLKKYLLLWLIMQGTVYEGNLGCFKLLDLFLNRGLLPQTVLHAQVLIKGYDANLELTFWQSFILVSAFEYIPEHDMGFLKGSFRVNAFGREYHQNFGEIIEKFLRLGADHNLWVWVADDCRSKIPADCFTCLDSCHVYANKCEVTFGRERKKIVFAAEIIRTTFQLINSKGGRISLRDLIVFWRLDNTETLLQLIDRNIEQQKQPTGDRSEAPAISQPALLSILENEEQLSKDKLEVLEIYQPALLSTTEK
jgi:hypothetical protein